MFRTLVLVSVLLGALSASAKSPDPSTADFDVWQVTCDEAQRIVNEHDEVTRVGFRGIFNLYSIFDVSPTNTFNYTQLYDSVFLNTKDGLSCYLGYGRFCRPDPRYYRN